MQQYKRLRPLTASRQALSRAIITNRRLDTTSLLIPKRTNLCSIKTLQKEIQQLESYVLDRNGVFVVDFLPTETIKGRQYALVRIDNKTMKFLERFMPNNGFTGN